MLSRVSAATLRTREVCVGNITRRWLSSGGPLDKRESAIEASWAAERDRELAAALLAKQKGAKVAEEQRALRKLSEETQAREVAERAYAAALAAFNERPEPPRSQA